MITQDKLKEYFNYNDGQLIWKKQPSTHIKVGDIAGNTNNRGYIQIKFLCNRFYAHRLIFFMFNGYFPQEVDHIDGNKTNNKIENLRQATPAQNRQNRGISKNNTSGIKGVSWSKKENKWIAQCQVNKKNHFLGRYNDIELAKKAVQQFRNQHHREYARHE
jgi:hypothetical protein